MELYSIFSFSSRFLEGEWTGQNPYFCESVLAVLLYGLASDESCLFLWCVTIARESFLVMQQEGEGFLFLFLLLLHFVSNVFFLHVAKNKK